MSDGKLTIEITGEEAKAHAAYMNLSKDQKALVREIGLMGEAAEKAANKSIQMAKEEGKARQDQIRLAGSLVKQNETLSQAYERQKAALDQALQAGTITAEQHKQTLESLDKKVRESSQEFIQASQQKQQAAKLEEAMLRDQLTLADSLVRKSKDVVTKYAEQKAALDAALGAGGISTQEYDAAMQHIKDEAVAAQEKLEDFEDATEQGVGQSSLQKIGEFATKFVTIAAAVNIVKKALEFYNAEKEKAMGSTNELQEVRRTMRQLSNNDFEQMENRADALTQFGLSRVQGRQLVADARAMGFEGSEEVVARANPVISLQESTVLAGTFREFFRDEQLGIEEAFNMALQGAEQHPEGIKEMIPQLATAATGRIEGGESSDVVASVAEIAKAVGISAGERIRNLGVALATNEKTKGLNMIDAMQLVGQDKSLRDEITGGNTVMQATVSAYLGMIDKIAKTDKLIEQAVRNSGTEKSLIKIKSEEATNPASLEGRIELARQQQVAAAASKEAETEKAFAEEAFKAKTAVDKVDADAIKRGESLPARLGISATASTLSYAGASDTMIENVGPVGGQGGEHLAAGLMFGPLGMMFNGARMMFERAWDEKTVTAEEPTPAPAAPSAKYRNIRDASGNVRTVLAGSAEEAEILSHTGGQSSGSQATSGRDTELQRQQLQKTDNQTSELQKQTAALNRIADRISENQFVGV